MLEDVMIVDCEAINSCSMTCSKLSIAVAKTTLQCTSRWREGGLQLEGSRCWISSALIQRIRISLAVSTTTNHNIVSHFQVMKLGGHPQLGTMR